MTSSSVTILILIIVAVYRSYYIFTKLFYIFPLCPEILEVIVPTCLQKLDHHQKLLSYVASGAVNSASNKRCREEEHKTLKLELEIQILEQKLANEKAQKDPSEIPRFPSVKPALLHEIFKDKFDPFTLYKQTPLGRWTGRRERCQRRRLCHIKGQASF
jgi:hypothetical protein